MEVLEGDESSKFQTGGGVVIFLFSGKLIGVKFVLLTFQTPKTLFLGWGNFG